MSENKTEILVGGVVLAAAIAFGVYAGQIAQVSAGGSHYPLTASFRSLEGVSVGTDVRLAGVKVGLVTDVTLNRETFRADATVGIDEGILIPEDSSIAIASEGLLGGSFVEIVPGGSPVNLEPGEEILDTQGAVSIVQLLLQFAGGGEGE